MKIDSEYIAYRTVTAKMMLNESELQVLPSLPNVSNIVEEYIKIQYSLIDEVIDMVKPLSGMDQFNRAVVVAASKMLSPINTFFFIKRIRNVHEFKSFLVEYESSIAEQFRFDDMIEKFPELRKL